MSHQPADTTALLQPPQSRKRAPLCTPTFHCASSSAVSSIDSRGASTSSSPEDTFATRRSESESPSSTGRKWRRLGRNGCTRDDRAGPGSTPKARLTSRSVTRVTGPMVLLAYYPPVRDVKDQFEQPLQIPVRPGGAHSRLQWEFRRRRT
jgi:hypothetical protein